MGADQFDRDACRSPIASHSVGRPKVGSASAWPTSEFGHIAEPPGPLPLTRRSALAVEVPQREGRSLDQPDFGGLAGGFGVVPRGPRRNRRESFTRAGQGSPSSPRRHATEPRWPRPTPVHCPPSTGPQAETHLQLRCDAAQFTRRQTTPMAQQSCPVDGLQAGHVGVRLVRAGQGQAGVVAERDVGGRGTTRSGHGHDRHVPEPGIQQMDTQHACGMVTEIREVHVPNVTAEGLRKRRRRQRSGTRPR